MLSNFAIIFPAIDPVLFNIGTISIRWYSIAYIAGILLGIMYIKNLDKNQSLLTTQQVDDMMIWVVLGIIIGGRLGYVFIYHPDYYLSNPEDILKTWNGGMSFHGGVVGVIIALYGFARKHKLVFLTVTDLVACVTPIGIMLGRIANFINGELYGRQTTLPWGVIFPNTGGIPRHPSQIYESITEGFLLFLIMIISTKKISIKNHPGFISGIFLSCYAAFRMAMEYFREPDENLGFIMQGITMGQILSVPMMALGVFLIQKARK